MTISNGQTITKTDLDGVGFQIDYIDSKLWTPMQRSLNAPAGVGTLRFTPNTDEELRAIVLRATAAVTGGNACTATLSVVGSNISQQAVGIFLLDQQPVVSLVGVGLQASKHWDAVDGERLFLHAGVSYQLVLEATGAPGQIHAAINTISSARRA